LSEGPSSMLPAHVKAGAAEKVNSINCVRKRGKRFMRNAR
jgi:hypothetical protein